MSKLGGMQDRHRSAHIWMAGVSKMERNEIEKKYLKK